MEFPSNSDKAGRCDCRSQLGKEIACWLPGFCMSRKSIEDIVEPCRSSRIKLPNVWEAFPEVAAEWDYEKNCGFGPEDFSSGSNIYVHWRCSTNPQHKWKAQICKRCGENRRCPDCFGKNLRGRKVIKERSLVYLFPAIAKEWHAKKNGDKTPRDVLAGSNEIVWWQCTKNRKHSWQAAIKWRTGQSEGCTLCYEERQLNLDKYPHLLKLFDHKKNLRMDHRKLTTTMDLWWRCPNGPDHVWKGKVRNKNRFGCEFCRNKKVSVTNSLKTLYPKLALQLHPTRNGKLTADKICAFTSKTVWWRCAYNPKHIWPAVVSNRTRQESGCPECYSARRSLINSKAMKKYYEKQRQLAAQGTEAG